ncbi:transglycosylase SLT domain-containing protein [Streptomyces sp. NPDC091279]|uniref:transglycosylase SLT domain-containing protein n=1 Tax=unclassified Streptomyces TaxID=2593676 RepID=UPI0037F9D90C
MNPVVVVAAAGGGSGLMGCIAFVMLIVVVIGVIIQCAIGVLLWPLVLICHIFGCGGGGGGGGDDGGGAQVDQAQIASAYQSDGTGELAVGSVPDDLLDTINSAGAECSQIGPIVIAAQIQAESGWNRSLVGTNGAEGISQLPPDKFKEFGKDTDDNGKTSALDAEDSIMAQGKYMCSLYGDVKDLIANNVVKGSPLDLTLTAYDLGLDAVKEAGGVPDTSRSQSYISSIRSQFALYGGAIKPPEGSAYPSMSASPYPTAAGTPTPRGTPSATATAE